MAAISVTRSKRPRPRHATAARPRTNPGAGRESRSGLESPVAAASKRDRREEGRQQREAIRKRAAQRNRLRKLAIGAVLVAVVAGAAVVFLNGLAASNRRSAEQRALLAQANAAAQSAGCTGVRTVPAAGGDDQQHTAQLPSLDSYPSQPPASGPHDQTPLGSGVYPEPPAIGMAIHSLEHGAVDIWLSPSATSAEVESLKSALGGQDHVIIAPYSYPGAGGQLPTGVQMALVAWHRIQQCRSVNAAVAVGFVASYDASTSNAYEGEAPEVGLPI